MAGWLVAAVLFFSKETRSPQAMQMSKQLDRICTFTWFPYYYIIYHFAPNWNHFLCVALLVTAKGVPPSCHHTDDPYLAKQDNRQLSRVTSLLSSVLLVSLHDVATHSLTHSHSLTSSFTHSITLSHQLTQALSHTHSFPHFQSGCPGGGGGGLLARTIAMLLLIRDM